MFGLALFFLYVFLLSLCLSCICLLAMHTLICVNFSLPPGVGGLLRLLFVALPGLFCCCFFCNTPCGSNFNYITITCIST